jgi:glycerol uptake facilitator-like aquaporin
VITAAYWFTSSTSFANPSVTLARGFTTTFSGIAINHVPAFIVAQIAGAFAAASVAAVLFPSLREQRRRATAARHEAIAPGE